MKRYISAGDILYVLSNSKKVVEFIIKTNKEGFTIRIELEGRRTLHYTHLWQGVDKIEHQKRSAIMRLIYDHEFEAHFREEFRRLFSGEDEADWENR